VGRGILSAALLAGLTALAIAAAATGASPAQPHVTVLGDSVLTAVQWNEAPLATLQKGFDMYVDVGVCRTVAGISCPYEGGRVPTLMDVIAGMGIRLGPLVLVEVGYNDDPAVFEREVDDAVEAMIAVGVRRILWVNVPATNEHWQTMDDALDAVASRYGQMTIVDWNETSRNQWHWFQGDGVHLLYPGAIALATLLNQALVQATAPPPPPVPLRPHGAALPSALVGRRYTTHLDIESGTAPYRWRSLSGPLPRGLHLLASGTISGVPRRAVRMPLVFQVTDAAGAVATIRETMVVRQPAPAAHAGNAAGAHR